MFDRFVEIQRAWREAADAGWKVSRSKDHRGAVIDAEDEPVCEASDAAHAQLIARAPADIKWLCAEVQRLKDELDSATSSGEVVGKSRDGDITLAKFKIVKPTDDER